MMIGLLENLGVLIVAIRLISLPLDSQHMSVAVAIFNMYPYYIIVSYLHSTSTSTIALFPLK